MAAKDRKQSLLSAMLPCHNAALRACPAAVCPGASAAAPSASPLQPDAAAVLPCTDFSDPRYCCITRVVPQPTRTLPRAASWRCCCRASTAPLTLKRPVGAAVMIDSSYEQITTINNQP